jgi:hypothetical protein
VEEQVVETNPWFKKPRMIEEKVEMILFELEAQMPAKTAKKGFQLQQCLANGL